MLVFDVQVPIADVLRAAADITEAERAGLSRVAQGVQNAAIRKVLAIRSRRVPTRREDAEYKQAHRITITGQKRRLRASNEPLWTPTGNLLRSVEAEPIWDGPTAVELRADVPYAEPRHELGVSRQPKHPALGIVRRDPFFADAEEITEPQIAPLFMDGFNSVWEGK